MRSEALGGPSGPDPAKRPQEDAQATERQADWLSWELERWLSETKLAYTLGG